MKHKQKREKKETRIITRNNTAQRTKKTKHNKTRKKKTKETHEKEQGT